jgi:hypothetical protein
VASEAVGDGSTAPKFSPLIVTVPPPLTAAFADAVVVTGAAKKRQFAPANWRSVAWRIAPSKLNRPVTVPVFALTLITVRTAKTELPYASGAHATVVADVQALEPHTSAVASEAVGDGSTAPKFSPLTVTVPPPLTAAFADAAVVTGAA